jgi:hypothetical protein
MHPLAALDTNIKIKYVSKKTRKKEEKSQYSSFFSRIVPLVRAEHLYPFKQ